MNIFIIVSAIFGIFILLALGYFIGYLRNWMLTQEERIAELEAVQTE